MDRFSRVVPLTLVSLLPSLAVASEESYQAGYRSGLAAGRALATYLPYLSILVLAVLAWLGWRAWRSSGLRKRRKSS